MPGINIGLATRGAPGTGGGGGGGFVSRLAIPGQTIGAYYAGGNQFSAQQSAAVTLSHPWKSGTFYVDGSTTGNGLFGTGGNAYLAYQAGRWSRLSLNWELFSGSAPAGTVAPNSGASSPYNNSNQWWSWTQVLAGGCDPIIAQWATGIKSMAPLVFLVDIQHEPELVPTIQNASTAPHLYAQMVRYVHDGLIANGCTNFEMAWCVSAELAAGSLPGNVDGITTLNQMYQVLWGISSGGVNPTGTPLDDICHWKLWDPYITSPSDNISKLTNFKTTYIDTGVLGPQTSSDYYGLGEWGIASTGGITTPQRLAYFGQVVGALVPTLHICYYFDALFGSTDVRVIGTSDGSIGAFTTVLASMA